MTRTMYIAAVFLATLASAQANQCTSGGGGGCTGDNAPQNIVSMLQTKLQANILEDGAKEDLLVNADAPQGHQGSGIIASKKPGQLASGFAKSNPDAVLTELQQNVRDGTTPPVEVISQIKSLITDDIMPGLQAARDIVAKETAKVMADIDTCNNDFTSSEAYPGSALQESVNTTRQNHSTCRHLEQEMYFDNLTHDSACVELGELLHRTFPSSIPSSHLHTSWRDAAVQYASDTLHAILELDGNCTNQESKLERKTKECASGQMRFESDFCYWKSSLESSCNELERCYSRTLSLYNEHVADLQVLHKKWDYESATLQKILCFCNVWLEETDGGDNRSQYNASHFTVCSDVTHTPSPLVIEPPPKANCLLSSVASHPGTVDFFTQEYTNFSNFVEAVVPCRDEPTTVAPTSSTQAPTTEAPTTEAPTTEAPTTGTPTTEAPTTEAPTTKAPTTEAPTTEAPTTEAPTTEASFPTKQLGQAPPSSSHGLVLGSADFTFTATVTITSEGGYPNILLARHTNGVASGWTFGFQSCWTHQCDLDNPILLGRIQFQTWAINGAYNGQGGFSVDSVISLNQAYRISFLRCGAAFELWIDGVKQTLDTGSFDASSFEDVSGNGDAEIRLGTWFGGIQFRGTITDAEMNGFCNIAAAKAR